MRQCQGEKLLSKQMNTLALRCLCSSRVDIRLVDIKAVQELRAEQRRTCVILTEGGGGDMQHFSLIIQKYLHSAEVCDPGRTRHEVKDDRDAEVSLPLSQFSELWCMM